MDIRSHLVSCSEEGISLVWYFCPKCLNRIDGLIWNHGTTGQKPKAQPSASYLLVETYYNINNNNEIS